MLFRVTSFCINTCFRSFTTLISRIVHHAVLKFSPGCNKPLPQASTCPCTRTPPVACPRRSTRAMQTRSSAIAEGPRDASCQLKSCQLPRNSAETTCATSPEQIKVMKLEGYSGSMCKKTCALNHDAIESLLFFYKCHKQTDHGRVVYITCIPTTCSGEIFYVRNVEIAQPRSQQATAVTLTTPTWGALTHHKTKTLHGRPVYKI